MRGLGTIINALAILVGGVLGILFKRFLKERYQDTIIKATGFSVVFLGAAGTLSKMLAIGSDGTLSTRGSMVMILSLALGALLGELIDLDAQFAQRQADDVVNRITGQPPTQTPDYCLEK